MNGCRLIVSLALTLLLVGCGTQGNAPTDSSSPESAKAQTESGTDPYMAQFITYEEALEAARREQADAPWRLIFMPEVSHEQQGTVEKIPTWIATAISAAGDREQVFIDARKDRKSHIYLAKHLKAQVPDLPEKEGTRPLTVQEALEKVCQAVDCESNEPVDIEFRAQVPLPEAPSGDTFPAWAVTLAGKSDHRMSSIGFFDVYTGVLVTEQAPPK